VVRVVIYRAGVILSGEAVSAPAKFFNSSMDAMRLFRFEPRLAKVSPLDRVTAIPIAHGDEKRKAPLEIPASAERCTSLRS
jgi:hypothetical protein